MLVFGQFMVSSMLLFIYLWSRGGSKKPLTKAHCEINYTVEIELEEDLASLCSNLGLKPILIELPVGVAIPKQWMTST